MDLYSVGDEYLKTGIKTPQVDSMMRYRPYHDEMLEAIERSNGRLLGCWWLNPHLVKEDYEETSDSIKRHGLKYIKLHPVHHAFAADDTELLGPVMELAGGLDVPLWVHSSSGPGTEAYRLFNLARSFPNNRIIMGHVLSIENTPEVIEMTNRVSNLWIDLALYPVCSLPRVFAEAPRERLLFSTDHPYCGNMSLKVRIEHITSVTLENVNLRNKILGENTAQLLKI